LMWTVYPGNLRDWESASSFCNNSSAGGFGDWRMPTVNELRSIVASCPATETGGGCGVTDGCNASHCDNGACDGCTPQFGGPGSNGCYWPTGLAGDCHAPYWSETDDASNATHYWTVDFSYAAVVSVVGTVSANNVRCVRSAA
jgi:hypothetical protein